MEDFPIWGNLQITKSHKRATCFKNLEIPISENRKL